MTSCSWYVGGLVMRRVVWSLLAPLPDAAGATSSPSSVLRLSLDQEPSRSPSLSLYHCIHCHCGVLIAAMGPDWSHTGHFPTHRSWSWSHRSGPQTDRTGSFTGGPDKITPSPSLTVTCHQTESVATSRECPSVPAESVRPPALSALSQ